MQSVVGPRDLGHPTPDSRIRIVCSGSLCHIVPLHMTHCSNEFHRAAQGRLVGEDALALGDLQTPHPQRIKGSYRKSLGMKMLYECTPGASMI